MTEHEWHTGTDLPALLKALGEPSIRKARLYAIACCRRIWAEMNEAGRHAVEVAERHVHGQATDEELDTACANANEVFRGSCTYGADTGHQPTRAAVAVSKRRVGSIIHNHLMAFQTQRQREQNVTLLRDIFPFQSPTFDPAWLTETVVALARGIYEDAAFERLPILADAIQEAGCEDGAILTHCRGPGPHVRGCWVIDACLSKS